MEELRVLSQAIQKWGNEAQEQQAVEEIGKLIVALNQYRRGRIPLQSVQEEIADVMIMAKQLSMIYGFAECEYLRHYKIERLAGRLKDKSK